MGKSISRMILVAVGVACFGHSDAQAETRRQLGTWTVELATDFPVQVGPSVRLETPHRLRISTGLGIMPAGYLDTINSVAVGAGWYDQQTADLLSFALEDSVVWSTRVGGRVLANRGLYVQGGYNLVTLGGGVSGVELVSAATGQALPSDLGVGRTMNVESTAHMLNVEAGWEWAFLNSGLIRVGVGGSFTVSADTAISPNWAPRPRAEAAIDALSDGGEVYLTNLIQDYVHTVVITAAAGWRF